MKSETQPRYFVDERGGCIAVRDREHTDPAYPGLHADTLGVVWYQHGRWVAGKCPICNQSHGGGWVLPDGAVEQATATCDELNRLHEKRGANEYAI